MIIVDYIAKVVNELEESFNYFLDEILQQQIIYEFQEIKDLISNLVIANNNQEKLISTHTVKNNLKTF